MKRIISLVLVAFLCFGAVFLSAPGVSAAEASRFSFEEPDYWALLEFGSHTLFVIMDLANSSATCSFEIESNGNILFKVHYYEANKSATAVAFWDGDPDLSTSIYPLNSSFSNVTFASFSFKPPASLSPLQGANSNIPISSSLINSLTLKPVPEFGYTPVTEDTAFSILDSIKAALSNLGNAIKTPVVSAVESLLPALENLGASIKAGFSDLFGSYFSDLFKILQDYFTGGTNGMIFSAFDSLVQSILGDFSVKDDLDGITDSIMSSVVSFAPALAFVSTYTTNIASGIQGYLIVFLLPLFIGLLFFVLSKVAGSTRVIKVSSQRASSRSSSSEPSVAGSSHDTVV